MGALNGETVVMVALMAIMYFKLSTGFKKAIKDEIAPVIQIQTVIVENIKTEMGKLEARTNTIEKVLYNPDGIIVGLANLKERHANCEKHREAK